MHLKSVTLKGFKSFSQPTTFAFDPGVTAIVGPNGSGKSNVVDALAWVMGEQGAKSLRGGKMEDVIFAGTSTKGPLGRAEVTLTIDNTDGALPIEYSEVSIRRTLFRSGASEYAINGESCRLLDVQELLSDSGLGHHMHVIVGQGSLDAVLQAGPEQRRGFIEEAAGILKHRRRKEKTIRKLEAMEHNLTRLTDLTTEIRRQLKPLGRQAEVAREAATIASTVRELKARLAADEYLTLTAQLQQQREAQNSRAMMRQQLESQKQQLRQKITELENDQNAEAVDRARNLVFGLEKNQERLRNLYALAGQRITLLDHDEIVPGQTVTAEAVTSAEQEVQRSSAELTAAEKVAERTEEDVARIRQERDALDAQLAHQSALRSEYEAHLATQQSEVSAAESARVAMESAVERQRMARTAAGERLAKAEAALATVRASANTGGESGSVDYAQAYEHAQQRVSEAENALTDIRNRVHAAEREYEALQSQIATLSRTLDAHTGSGDLVEEGVAGLRGLVGEAVQVRSGYETAIAAALGSLYDAVLADNRDQAFAAAQLAATKDLGVVDIVIADTAIPDHKDPKISGITPATSVVTAPDGVLGVLSSVFIADDLDAAQRAWRELSAAYPDDSAMIVTTAGQCCSAYMLRAGSGSSRSRLELSAERDAATSARDALATNLDSMREQLQAASTESESARQQNKAALDELRAHDSRLATEMEAVNRATATQESAVAECERLDTSLTQAQESLREATERERVAHEELQKAQSVPAPTVDTAARDAVSDRFDAAQKENMRALLECETLRERVRADQERVQALSKQREDERTATNEAARRRVLRRAQRDAASELLALLPPVVESVDRSLAQARTHLAEAETHRNHNSAELNRLRLEENEVLSQQTGVSESVHAAELEVQQTQLQIDVLVQKVSDELAIDADILVAEYGSEVLDQTPDAGTSEASDSATMIDREQLRRELRGAERKRADLGRINPLALEEFSALEKRHAFLSEQLADLTKTRQDLLDLSADLDERMREIFVGAFEDTREAFEEIFPILFPGGRGALSLCEPDQPLTSGVEVTVRPAGKKVERLSLLSGGERSLAAVALLVAIFKARPSPFYILDEVEAALDDANLGRLLTVFKKLRDDSQLIVITHQKRTMEIADALYGVSMRQDGVSAVVGQRVRESLAS